jgi:Transposase DDE domain group 1
LITIDLDVTDDPTHGAQQLTFFNGFYDHWCYLPLVGTLTFDDETRQYLVTAILRPGNAAGTAGVVSLLHRLLPKLWRAFPGARLRVPLPAFAERSLRSQLRLVRLLPCTRLRSQLRLAGQPSLP